MSGSEDEDPLKSLLVDGQEINRERLARALSEYVLLDESSGEPIIQPEFRKLDTPRRIVAILLARRAAVSLDLLQDEEVGIQSGPLSEYAGAAGSTVRRYVSEKINFADADPNLGGYYIPTTKILQAIEFLEDAKVETK